MQSLPSGRVRAAAAPLVLAAFTTTAATTTCTTTPATAAVASRMISLPSDGVRAAAAPLRKIRQTLQRGVCAAYDIALAGTSPAYAQDVCRLVWLARSRLV